MSETGKIFVISGPSGVGKSTIVKEVLARTGAVFSVSATTRPRRAGEVDGQDYSFVDRKTFEQMVAAGQMLEWAEVFGNLYGTPRRPVVDATQQGKTIILDIDVQGAVQVHAKMPHATFVLIEPPSQESLRDRLRRRGTETDADLNRRLGKAIGELQAAGNSGIYTYRVVNDDLEKAVDEVVRIVNQEHVNK